MSRARLLLLTLVLTGSAFADEADEPAEDRTEDANPAPTPEQQAEYGRQRAKKADSSFDAIMKSNEAPPKGPELRLEPAAAELPKVAPSTAQAWHTGVATSGESAAPAEPPSTATVPLDRYQGVREQLDQVARKEARPEAPPVTLGAAEYRGEEKHQALALTATLSVTLGAPGHWKTVPLLGVDAVIVSARSGNAPIPISTQDGFHVWVTQETGEKTITLEILAPARGPRGSIEYDLVVDRTPVTHFACRFPLAGLEPRIDDAVHAEVQSGRDDTTIDATVKPTTRLHLVGFRDLGEGASTNARVYAESLNLLSVEETSVDVFSVIRYTILYGGTKDFQVLVPAGIQVVSADGEGAFRYTLEKREDGTLIKGETAFPIRNSYEISIRLHRETPRSIGTNSGETFQAPLPRSQKVEREDGWLGVEVPGKMRLEEQGREEALPVDVRQLPEEMVQSAVTPILLAYRYQADHAKVELKASRLPERAPSGASIDRIRATSVQAAEGRLLTELRISLRNRLRHSLSMELPPGARVLSTLLDGQPVKPSRDEQGHLLLPLRRSGGVDRAKPFVLQVVLEKEGTPFGAFGQPELVLPAFDLPVSSLAWTVYLPAANSYGSLRSDVADESLNGEGSWSPALQAPGTDAHPQSQAAGEPSGSETAASADTGAMPVRIKLPETGVRLDYSRYWLEANQPLTLRFRYLRSSLRAPLFFAASIAFACALWMAIWGSGRRRIIGEALALAIAIGLWTQSALWVVLGGLAMIAVARALRPGSFQWIDHLGTWARELPTRFRDRPRVEPAGRLRMVSRVIAGAFGLWVVGHIAIAALKVAILLVHPL